MKRKLPLLLSFLILLVAGCDNISGVDATTITECKPATSCNLAQKDGTCAVCCDKTTDVDCTNEPGKPGKAAPDSSQCTVTTDCIKGSTDNTCATCCDKTTDDDCTNAPGTPGSTTPAPSTCDVATDCQKGSTDNTCATCCDKTTDDDCTNAPGTPGSTTPPACVPTTDCKLAAADGTCPSCCDYTNDADCTQKLTATIGIACTKDDQCGTDGICIKETDDSEYKGGYCSAVVTDPAKQECPDGSVPSFYRGKAYCMKSCEDTTSCGRTGTDYRCDANICAPNRCNGITCDPDKSCLEYDVTAHKSMCVKKCEPSKQASECGNDEVCSPVFGFRDAYCMKNCKAGVTCLVENPDFACIASPNPVNKICYTKTINAKVFAPCTSDFDCGPEGECAHQTLEGLNVDGYCRGKVTKSRDTCPSGSVKTSSFLSGDSCDKGCSTPADCRGGTDYTCNSIKGVCEPNRLTQCASPSDCTLPDKCLDITGLGSTYCRVPSTGKKKIGEPCSSYDECAGEEQAACKLYNLGDGSGLCTKTCDPTAAPAVGCDTGELCEKSSAARYYCETECTGTTDCPDGFKCATAVSDASKMVCKKKTPFKKADPIPTIGDSCQSDAECGFNLATCLYPTELGTKGYFPGGYCTFRATFNTTLKCPEGTEPGKYGTDICLKKCIDSSTCRRNEGYSCYAPKLINANVCYM